MSYLSFFCEFNESGLLKREIDSVGIMSLICIPFLVVLYILYRKCASIFLISGTYICSSVLKFGLGGDKPRQP